MSHCPSSLGMLVSSYPSCCKCHNNPSTVSFAICLSPATLPPRADFGALELYILQLSSMQWNLVLTTGIPPPCSTCYAAMLVNEDQLLIISASRVAASQSSGASQVHGAVCVAWVSLKTKQWHKLSLSACDVPTTSEFSCVCDGVDVYLFGGVDATCSLRNTVHALNTEAAEWTLLQV